MAATKTSSTRGTKTTRTTKLNFEYCECGCKCYTADIYHIFWDLKDAYTLSNGRFRDNPADFASREEAEAEAQRRYDARMQSKVADPETLVE